MKNVFSVSRSIAIACSLSALSALAMTDATWTAEAMSSDGSTISTNGTIVCAYAFSSRTVNGVSFSACRSFQSGDGMVSFTPAISGTHNDYYKNHSQWNDFGGLINDGWYWNNDISSVTLTLEGLTAGSRYLVQLVSHSCQSSELNMAISVGGTPPQPVGKTSGEQDAYKYGASVVGVFTASSAAESFVITYSGSEGERPLNAIQVRELASSSPVSVPGLILMCK